MSSIIDFHSFTEGDQVAVLEAGPVRHMDLVRYSGASGDFNPIHTDPQFAKEAGLDGTIVHGMYVMAQLGRMLSDFTLPSQIRSFGVKFKGMVKPQDKLMCKAQVKRKKEEEGEKLLLLSLQASVGDNVCVAGEALIACA